MLRAFHLPDEGSPWQTRSNGVKRRESIAKKFKRKWEDLFFSFGLHFQYVGMSLKLGAPAKKEEEKKEREFTDKEKKQEKCLRLWADPSAWQTGEVTVAVFGIFEIRHKKTQKNKMV